MEKKNCAFQYATQGGRILVDKTELTMSEAKKLWNENYKDCARKIYSGTPCQMYLWINMDSPEDFKETLWQIDNDAESDGFKIWATQTTHFPKTI